MVGVKAGLQTKLIFLLVLVSLVSMAVVAAVCYRSARQSLEQNVYDRLTSIREARKAQLAARMTFIRGQIATLSEDKMILDAIKDFKAAVAKLPETLQSEKALAQMPARDKGLRQFYEADFLPALRKNHDGNPQLETYLPKDAVTRYLQYHYLAANPHPYLNKEKLDAGVDDPSDYGKVHGAYHPKFRKIAQTFGYDNLMLIDLESGHVLYNVRKTTEFGTDLANGAYSGTAFADVVRLLRKNKDPNLMKSATYEPFAPNLNTPSSFMVSTVADGPNVVGLLVFQFPMDGINRVITGDYEWERDGLGKTGEVVLVAHDHKMRSLSRFYYEDPEAYLETLQAAGYPKGQIKQIQRSGTTILAQEIRSPEVEAALTGEADTGIVKDYRGKVVLSSHAPVELSNNRWAILVKMDADEAFAPIRQFERDVAIVAVATTLLLGLVALGLSWQLVRPLHRLLDGARKVATGRNDVTVKVSAQDETRELADAFNAMTGRLQGLSGKLAAQEQAHAALLRNILPGPAAERVLNGQQQISDDHPDVTVLFAKLVGFTELAENLPAERAIALLNDLVVAFDDAAERFGVEKVKTAGATYMAACGLSVQRPDHAHRMVEFAQELLRIVRVFGQENGMTLAVQVGLHCGPVVGGVVGRTRFVYDLWGETVNLAANLQQVADPDTILVTQALRDRLRDLDVFRGPDPVELPRRGVVAVWTVLPQAVPAVALARAG